jgi:hypothetical protein
MKQVPIEEATDEQIIIFARDVQQIAEIPTTRGPLIQALIKSGWDRDYVMVDGEERSPTAEDTHEELEQEVLQMLEPEVKPIPFSTVKGFGFFKKSPMVVCKIMSTDRPGGNEPAHPSVNGSPPLVIQRNRLVEIPWDFFLVLRQAGGTKILPGEKATDELVRQDYLEYPLTDIRLPSRASVVAWQERTSKMELGHAKQDEAA